MKPRKWVTHRVEPKGDYRVFSVDALHSQRAGDGYEHVFFRINSPSWVNVVARTPEGDFVMVRQHRLGSGTVTLEVPGGLVDDGEDPAAAAVRELAEETGYRPASIHRIGEVNPNPALFANRVHTFLARDCIQVGAIKNDASEETVVELVPAPELKARVRRGDIDHAIVLAALYWYELNES